MSNDNSFGRNSNDRQDRDRNRRDLRSSNENRRNTGGRDRSPLRSNRNPKNDCRVFVSNLPYDYRWQDLKDLLRNEIGEVSYVELFSDENDKSRGCGIVEFEAPDSVKKAIEKLHRYDVDGRKIIVKEDSGAARDRYGTVIRTGGRDRDRDENRRSNWEGGRDMPSKQPYNWGETFGLSPNFLEGLGIAPPLVNKVFIANLDYKVTERKLREVFKLAGKVIDVDLSVDADGKSRGFAVVEFDHAVESVQAISMLHNQQLYDRRLTVRMDRVDPFDGNSRLPEGLHSVGMGLGTNGTPLRDVAKNLPSLTSLTGLTSVGNISALQSQTGFNNLTAAAALSAAVPPLGLGPSAAALQAAAALNPSSTSLLGPAGSLDLLAARSDFSARDLALSNLAAQAGLGGSLSASLGQSPVSSLNSQSRQPMQQRDSFVDRDLRSLPSVGSFLNNNNNNNTNNNQRSNLSSNNSAQQKTSDTVLVDNLPHNFTWQQLKDKFRECGSIKFAEMRGKLGLVRFSSEWEALRAVSLMDHTRVDGQSIDVRLF